MVPRSGSLSTETCAVFLDDAVHNRAAPHQFQISTERLWRRVSSGLCSFWTRWIVRGAGRGEVRIREGRKLEFHFGDQIIKL